MEQYLIFNSLNYPILTVLVAVPLVGALITLFIRGDRYLKIWGLMVTLITAVLSLPLYSNFEISQQQNINSPKSEIGFPLSKSTMF